jgi:hypothetical protein
MGMIQETMHQVNLHFLQDLQHKFQLVQSVGSWVPVEEEMSPRQLNRTPREFPLDSDPMNIEKHRTHHPSFFHKVESNIPSDRMIHENQRQPKEVTFLGTVHL